jgi:hypothetical protein
MVVMVVLAPSFPLMGGGGVHDDRRPRPIRDDPHSQYSTHFQSGVEHLSGQMFLF